MAARGKVRIIGGKWRSRLLGFPAIPDLRPTSDRIRETIFNWLGQDLTGLRCLDLFAGSGALGFEAASRGAASVVMVDRDARAYHALQENKEKLQATQVECVKMDAMDFIRLNQRKFDVVFLDPPFRLGLLAELLPLLSLLSLHLEENGLIYTETPAICLPDEPWHIRRSAKAGAVHYQLLGLPPRG